MKTAKKLLSLLLCAILASGSAAVGGEGFARAFDTLSIKASAQTYSDLEYEINDGEVTITGCNETVEGALEIPSIINGCSVTRIGYNAFYNCSGLTSIIISEGVTRIDDNAFEDCANLTSITIPDSVISIGRYSFNNTGYYNDKSNWEDGVLYINNQLISANDDELSESYEIKSDTITIADYAFFCCESLTSINISGDVKNIGESAFEYCVNLTDVVIHNGVKSIGDGAFDCCVGLTSISLPEKLTSIGDWAFAACFSLESITIPDNVTSIGDYVFTSCFSLTDITFGSQLTYISEGAFSRCISLTEVVLPDTIIEIYPWAFSRCLNLTNITFGENISAIYGCAFDSTRLERVIIPDNADYIGECAFACCPSLEYIHIPAKVTTIEDDVILAERRIESLYTDASDGWISYSDIDEFLSLEFVTTYICSDSEDCYAKTYAAENGVEFRLCTGHPEQPSSCVDGQTGIQIVYDADAFGGKEIQLHVTYTSTDEEADALLHDFALSKLSRIFNIYLTFNDSEIQPESPVKVRIPYDNPIVNISKIKVFHYFNNASGGLEYEKIGNLTYVDGYIEFYTSHFSKFVIVEENTEPMAVIRNMSRYNNQTVDYRSTITFFADTKNCTDVEWYVNGQKVASNADGSCTVTQAKEDIEIYFTAKDTDGNTVKSETENITVKHGFFDKIISFFKGLFKKLPVIIQ